MWRKDMKRRKRIREEYEVKLRYRENGVDKERIEKRVRYIHPPRVPAPPPRKLNFSTVPGPLWKLNLRAFIKKSQWDNLREAIIHARTPRCEVCGQYQRDGSMHAHEEWFYDTDGIPAIAYLTGIGLQCKRCHQAEHYGLTQMFHAQGHISDEELEEIHQHYCDVNGVTRKVMKLDHDQERERWAALNAYPWEIDWGPFEVMLGKRVEAGDFNVMVKREHDTLTATPTTDHGPLPHIGLARPFGTSEDRHWAVPLVEARSTNRIGDDCTVVGFVFITRNAVRARIKEDARELVGKTYLNWRTIPDDPNLDDFAHLRRLIDAQNQL